MKKYMLMCITIDLKKTNLFVSVKIISFTTILLFLISCNNGNEKFEQYKKCDELWYEECDSIVENDSTCYRYAVYVDCIKLFFKILEGDEEASYTNYLKIFNPWDKEHFIMDLKYADKIVTGQIYFEDIYDSIRIKNKNPKHHSSLYLEELKKHKLLFHTDPEYEIFIPDHYISCERNVGESGSDKMFVYVKTPTDKYGLLFSFLTEYLESWFGHNTGNIVGVKNENCTSLFDLIWEETYKHQHEQLIRFSESH